MAGAAGGLDLSVAAATVAGGFASPLRRNEF